MENNMLHTGCDKNSLKQSRKSLSVANSSSYTEKHHFTTKKKKNKLTKSSSPTALGTKD